MRLIRSSTYVPNVKCNSSPTLIGTGHQRTVSTSTGCIQRLSLAKPILKVAHVGKHCRSLVAPHQYVWVGYKHHGRIVLA